MDRCGLVGGRHRLSAVYRQNNGSAGSSPPRARQVLRWERVGATYGVQVAANISQNGLNVQALTDVNWAAVGGGAVAGVAGVGTFGVGIAALGTSLAGTVAAGGLSGAIAGQAARATENVLIAQPIAEGLGDPIDIARDALAGTVLAGVGSRIDLALVRARYPGYYSRYISEAELEAI